MPSQTPQPPRLVTAQGDAPDRSQPRWARVAEAHGWWAPDAVWAAEERARVEGLRELVERLADVLPFDIWLDVKHVADTVADDTTAGCSCHHPGRLYEDVPEQGALW